MESYQTWFGEGPELSVLRMLGLFDRPADEKALGVLLKPPPSRPYRDTNGFEPDRVAHAIRAPNRALNARNRDWRWFDLQSECLRPDPLLKRWRPLFARREKRRVNPILKETLLYDISRFIINTYLSNRIESV